MEEPSGVEAELRGYQVEGFRWMLLLWRLRLGGILADTRFFDPRYRRSARARVGVTARHMLIGGAVLAGGVMLWRQRRR